MFFAAPNSSFGYYRGSPKYLGGAASGGGSGPQVAGTNVFAQGQGTDTGNSAWSPTILYLVALVFVEMIVFGFISRHL